ncbi:MAG: BMP family ABC transporter substrate-binding protein [Clostridia bacterium]|nr:BMP family ABC transporter substrate-binding protein [Clostridia bacterium]
MLKKLFCILLAATLCALSFGCGKAVKPITPSEAKIGVVMPDSGTIGLSGAILQGLQKSAASLGFPEPICINDVTDTAFDASSSLSLETEATETQAETTLAPSEPESFTQEDGQVVVRAVPVPEQPPVTAADAAAQLLNEGCGILVFADARYDGFSAWLAPQFKDAVVLQYRGAHTDIPNLQSFSDSVYEAFYLAGVAAGSEGVKQIGFTARKGDAEEKQCINAFALGAAAYEPKAHVTVGFTGVDLDLDRERTVPLSLIETDKCALLAQSVYTALPVSVAANIEGATKRSPLPCIGFGYDMVRDGGSKYLCSVVYNFSVYFDAALTALQNGAFDPAPYTGGVKEKLTVLSPLQNASEKTVKNVQAAADAFAEGSLSVFDGFKSEKNGYASNVTIR